MSDYNFSTLNDKEFERIVRELLNAKFNLGLQDFKIGKDKGVDLRFSTPENNNAIVVQVKRLVETKYAQLKYALEKIELPKVRLLNPERYIVATSLKLSNTEKNELKDLLSPFVLSANDIIGQEDLNGYLGEFPKIEADNFKLWFSSVTVFNSILHNAIEGRTRHLLEKVKRKIAFYVVTEKLDEAKRILQKEQLLLITGQPGIGKSTLAEMILAEKARIGYSVYQVTNINEAEDVFSQSEDEKQLFYYDDFLGASYLEIMNSGVVETQLTAFIDRVRSTPNKFLILTTRTVILNVAKEKYEKIGRSRLSDEQFELKLLDYSKYEKALILYNHLFFNKISDALFESIVKDRFYLKIIEHPNYTPRIMEFITEKSLIEQLSPEHYHQFILNNLNSPSEIWRYSFNNQINYLDRCFLLTLFTYSRNASEQSLIETFESRLNHEMKEHGQLINADQFNLCVRTLQNGFITVTLRASWGDYREYSFINPSLTDFFIAHVAGSYQERKSIISSMIHIDQLDKFDPEKRLLPLEKDLQLIIRNKFADGSIAFAAEDILAENPKYALKADALCRYCKDVNIDSLVLENLKKIDWNIDVDNIIEPILYVLQNINDAPECISHIKSNFFSILDSLMDYMSLSEQAEQIPFLFLIYDYDFIEFSESSLGSRRLEDLIQYIIECNDRSIKNENASYVSELEDVKELYSEVTVAVGGLKSILFPHRKASNFYGEYYDERYWKDQIEYNLVRRNQRSRMEEDISDQYDKNKISKRNEADAIDDLFVKLDSTNENI